MNTEGQHPKVVDEERLLVTESSGNVFADIGVKNPDLALVKADLAAEILAVALERGWTQDQTAVALGIDQPKVSALLRGRLSGFSIERLMRFLNLLDQNIEISVKSYGHAPAGTTVLKPKQHRRSHSIHPAP